LTLISDGFARLISFLKFFGVDLPGRQGAKTQEHLDIPRFRTGSRAEFIGVQNGKLFLNEP
jgi:hypothetical protein